MSAPARTVPIDEEMEDASALRYPVDTVELETTNGLPGDLTDAESLRYVLTKAEKASEYVIDLNSAVSREITSNGGSIQTCPRIEQDADLLRADIRAAELAFLSEAADKSDIPRFIWANFLALFSNHAAIHADDLASNSHFEELFRLYEEKSVLKTALKATALGNHDFTGELLAQLGTKYVGYVRAKARIAHVTRTLTTDASTAALFERYKTLRDTVVAYKKRDALIQFLEAQLSDDQVPAPVLAVARRCRVETPRVKKTEFEDAMLDDPVVAAWLEQVSDAIGIENGLQRLWDKTPVPPSVPKPSAPGPTAVLDWNLIKKQSQYATGKRVPVLEISTPRLAWAKDWVQWETQNAPTEAAFVAYAQQTPEAERWFHDLDLVFQASKHEGPEPFRASRKREYGKVYLAILKTRNEARLKASEDALADMKA